MTNKFAQHGVYSATKLLLESIGEDTNRKGLMDTACRVSKAWAEWTSGYDQDPQAILTSFAETTQNQMIVVKDITFYSKCEHHLSDIFGTVTIGYVPNGKIVGLSKLSRLVDVFARRLQVQERMTAQIAEALWSSDLSSHGVGVMVKARHMCLESRGVCRQGQITITSTLHGVMAHGSDKIEFMNLARD